MKLTLKNFRSHAQSSFEFPDIGFIKLSAPSGTGKSNVFKAIQWGLWGGKGNVVKYGTTETKVGIEIGDLKVCRGKGPAFLDVNGMTGEAGQAHVAGMLGMNELEFEISSYIAQDQANSFIHCKPAEQMELLQKLAFDKDNPEEMKEQIKTLIKDAEKKSQDITSAVNLMQNTIANKQQQADALLSIAKKPSEPPVDVVDVKRTKDTLQKQAIDLNTLIFEDAEILKTQMPTRDKANRASVWLETAKIEQAEKQKWFDENPEEKFALKVDLDNARIQKQHLTAQVKEFNEMMQRVADRNGCERKVTTYSRQLWELIVGAFESGESQVIGHSKGLNELTSKLIQAKADLDAADNRGVHLQDPTNALAQAIDAVKELEKAEADWIAKDAVRNQKKKDVLELNINIKKAETAIADAAGLETLDIIQSRVEKHKAERDDLRVQVAALDGKITNATAINNQWETYEKNQKLYHKYGEELVELNANLEQQEANLTTLNTRLGKLDRLLKLVQKAALSALDARITEINVRAEHWLDVLFSGTLQATIETEKEQKNGNVSHKINLAIYENGTKIDKKEELSGGQQSRLALAFQLALSDMYRSPVLCLDESLKGCDPETSKICLEAIRQISERKLVLMVEHHVADSQFDDVVRL